MLHLTHSDRKALRAALLMAAVSVFAALVAHLLTRPAAAADAEAAYNNACRTCHSVKPDDNRLGPHLNGVVGRKAGAATGFAYSDAVKNAGITWDEATLDKFITDPDSVVAGNNMKPFTGISDAATRTAIIEYLKWGGAAK